MARFASVNGTDGGFQVAYHLFTLKTQAKLAGWTVPRSSDGLTYNSTGDQITVVGTGAGGMGNTRAWYVLQDPAGRRQLCLQNVAGAFRGKFSESAKFTGGAPAILVVPSATDEQLYGTGTDAAPSGIAWSTNCRHHIVVESTPIGGVYPISTFLTVTPGSTQGTGGVVMEAMAPGSYRASDVSPVLVAMSTSATPIFSGWIAYGTGSQSWQAMSAVVGPYTGSLPVDLIDSADLNGFPLYTAAGPGGVRPKGYGTALAAKGPARTYPATANLATDAKVYLGAIVWPFLTGATAPGV